MVGAHTHLDLEMTCITTVLIPAYLHRAYTTFRSNHEMVPAVAGIIRNDVGLIFFQQCALSY